MKKITIFLFAGVLLQGCAGTVKKGPEFDGMASMRIFSEVFATIQTEYLELVSEDTLIDNAIAGMYEEGELQPPESARSQALSTPGERMKLTQLKRLLDAYHDVQARGQKVDGERLWVAATRRMVKGLDPLSAYLDIMEFNELKYPSRWVGGIGVGIKAQQERMVIAYLFADSPAESGGLQSGDEIVEVDGEAVTGRPHHDVIRMLRGKLGSEVRLLVRSGGELKTMSFIRKPLVTPRLECRVLDKRKLYLKPYDLVVGLSKAFGEQVQAFEAATGEKPDKLVIDLRGNRGGVLAEAIGVIDQFIASGTLADLVGREPKDDMNFIATTGGAYENSGAVTVLVDESTASGAELIAASLQDFNRAQIIGERTGGYGTVQTIFPLRNGGALKLTQHRIFRPSGKMLSEGIDPDTLLAEQPGDVSAPDFEETECQGSKIFSRIQHDAALRLAVE